MHLKEDDPFKDTDALSKVKIPFERFLKSWELFKGDAQAKVAGNWNCKLSWKVPAASNDAARACLYNALLSYAKENAHCHPDVFLCVKSACLRAGRDFKANELQVVPYAHLNNITTTAKGAVDIGCKPIGGVKVYVTKPPQPQKESSCDKWKDEEHVNPFWWVTSTDGKKKANIKTKFVSVEGVTFIIYTNSRGVSKFDKLERFKEKLAPSKLAGASIVEESNVEDNEAGDGEPAPKKAGDGEPARKKART